MQECCANEDIPVQFCSSQLIVSMATPVQFSPPLLASCSKTRVRVCSPAPQSLEQFDHSLHADHKQSTTTFNTHTSDVTSHTSYHDFENVKRSKGRTWAWLLVTGFNVNESFVAVDAADGWFGEVAHAHTEADLSTRVTTRRPLGPFLILAYTHFRCTRHRRVAITCTVVKSMTSDMYTVLTLQVERHDRCSNEPGVAGVHKHRHSTLDFFSEVHNLAVNRGTFHSVLFDVAEEWREGRIIEGQVDVCTHDALWS